MLLAVVNNQKESWLVTPWVEALLWTKTIAGVHVLTGHGAIATHMTCLTLWSISLQLYGEDSCKKVSFWSDNHSYPNQTRNGTQVAGDQKVPFPRSIMTVHGGESLLLYQSHVLFHSNKIRNNNGRWHKLDFPTWSELSHAVDLVGSSLNCSSSWSWLENHFLNEVIFMSQHQYVRGLLGSAQKKF
jgi:hypothetical protein